MATYLQGVPNLLPEVQPFQPDLNFYANILQTKQNQYDKNWKALNDLYGQVYYADLSRESNVEKKEHLLKNIEFNLKRVSGLDLSLQQNVTQATQVFKPFYDDKVLLKDMAWTKNYMNARGRGTGLKNAEDEKLRSQYWDAGIRELDYRREEFAATSDEESMTFGNVTYTPYLNVNKEALKIAKEAGLSVESVDFSPDGKWIIKKKNGQQLMAPLQKLFESTLGKDPRIMDVYRTQSYVNRKDYAYNNAAQFGGDKDKAELDYLQKNFTMLKDRNTRQLKELKEDSRVNDARKKDVEDQVAKGKATIAYTGSYLDALNEAQQINQTLTEDSEELNETLSNGSSTLSTSTGFQNPYGDLKSLRQKVDAGMASLLMQKDLGEAAYIYAHRDMKVDIEANPYKVLEIKQANRMAAIRKKAELDRKNQIDKWRVKNGLAYYDPITGEAKDNRAVMYPQKETTDDAATGEVDIVKAAEEAMEGEFQKGPEIMINGLLQMVERGLNNGTMSEKDVKNIFGYDIKRDVFQKKLKEGRGAYIQELISKYAGNDKDGNNYLGRLASRANNWMTEHSKLDVVKSYGNKILPFVEDAKILGTNMQNLTKVRNQAKEIILDKMEQLGIEGNADLYFNEDGSLKSKVEIEDRLKEITDQIGGSDRAKTNAFMKVLNTSVYGPNSTLAKWGEGLDKWAASLMYTEFGSYIRAGMNPSNSAAARDVALHNLYDTLSDNYDKVHKLYTSSDTWEKVDKLPYLGVYGKGTGLASTAMSYIVPPKGYGSPGHNVWLDFTKQFLGTDIDYTETVLTADGRSKDSYDSAKDNRELQRSLNGMLNDLIAQAADPNNSLTPFRIRAQAIAAQDTGKSAITIVPTMDFIKGYIDKSDDAPEGAITPALATKLTTEGISIIGKDDLSIFDTKILSDLYTDPVTSVVQTNDEYEYNDIGGRGYFKVTQDDKSLSGMSYEYAWQTGYDENGEKTWEYAYSDVTPGQNLYEFLQTNIMPSWDAIQEEYKY